METLDGTALAGGKTVRITATVWAWTTPSSDHLDLYFAANGASPTWTLINTLTPTAAGVQTLTATYTLPTGSTLQAIRAQFRYNSTNAVCSAATTATLDSGGSVGEYTSVTTQNEQVAAEVAKEREELRKHPEDEQLELVAMLRERGLSRELAQRVARDISTDPTYALRIHALEELGVDPDEQPSPWLAAISSFLCFAVGAMVPLLSYLLGSDQLWRSLALGGLGLFAAGAVVSRFTTRGWLVNGVRQLVLGALAAGVTYLVGRLIGGVAGG